MPKPPKPKKKPPFKQDKPKTIGKTKRFQAQKSIGDAEKWGIANGVAEQISYTGMDIKYANDVNKRLWELRKIYKSPMKRIDMNVSGAYAHADHDHISFNPKWFGDVAKLQRARKSEMDSGFKVLTKSTESAAASVATHEFGHTLALGVEVKGFHKWPYAPIPANPAYAPIKQIRREYRAANKKNYKDIHKTRTGTETKVLADIAAAKKKYDDGYISDYANYKYSQTGDDYSEFIAESFLQYGYGIKANAHVKKFGEFMKKQFGVKNDK